MNCIRTLVHEHTQLVTGGTVNIPEPLSVVFELGAPRTRVPGLRLRFLAGIKSVAKNRPKECLVRARILTQETPLSDAAPLT